MQGMELSHHADLPNWGWGTLAPARKPGPKMGLGEAGSLAAGMAPLTPSDSEVGLAPLQGPAKPEIAEAPPLSPNDGTNPGELVGNQALLDSCLCWATSAVTNYLNHMWVWCA